MGLEKPLPIHTLGWHVWVGVSPAHPLSLIMAEVIPRDPLALPWWQPCLQLALPCSSPMAIRRDKGVSDVMGPPRDIATVFRGHASMSNSPSGTNPIGTREPLLQWHPEDLSPTPAVALTPLGGCPWGRELWDIAEMGAGSLRHPARCPRR